MYLLEIDKNDASKVIFYLSECYNNKIYKLVRAWISRLTGHCLCCQWRSGKVLFDKEVVQSCG